MNEAKIDVIITVAAGTILLSLFLVFVVLFILNYRKKQKEYEWEQEQVKQMLLKTEIEIKEQTLSDISRELHDNLGQVASLIKINLGMITQEVPKELKEKTNDSLELTQQLILDIKSLSTTLKGENLSRFGLFEMIKKDLQRLSKISNINFTLIGRDELCCLSSEKEIFLYRMSQEIFNNILQHAQASEAELKITISKSQLIFIFRDNGIGFNILTNKKGNGLMNMEERCNIIKANLNIQSEKNNGTRITISLNL